MLAVLHALSAVVVFGVTGVNRLHIDSSHSVARTIFIDTSAVRSTQFHLTEADQELLYRTGRRAATEFPDGKGARAPWDFEAYKARFRTPPA